MIEFTHKFPLKHALASPMDRLPPHLFRDIFDLTPCPSVAWLHASRQTLCGVGNTFSLQPHHEYTPDEFHFVPPHLKRLADNRWVSAGRAGYGCGLYGALTSRLGHYVTGNHCDSQCTRDNFSMLAWAVAGDNVKMCSFWRDWVSKFNIHDLLQVVWSPQLNNRHKCTLLQIAASHDSVRVCEWLRTCGMCLHHIGPIHDVACCVSGFSVLSLALDNNALDVCYFLNEMGQNLFCHFKSDHFLWRLVAQNATVPTFQMLKHCGVLPSTRAQATDMLAWVVTEGRLEVCIALRDWISQEKIYLRKEDVSTALVNAAENLRNDGNYDVGVCEALCQWFRQM